MLKANTETNIYTLYFVNRFQAVAQQPGSVQLKQAYVGTLSGTGLVTQPLHLVSLTAAPNAYNGNLYNPVGMHILQYSDPGTSGVVAFGKFGNWQMSNTAGVSGTNQSIPGSIDTLKAVSIKMALHGTTTRPTRYLIQMVQLKKPYLHPEYIEAQQGSFNEVADVRGFYDELTRPYTYSPAGFFDSKHRKDIKVLKSWSQIIQPRIATDQMETTNAQSGTSGAFPHTQLLNIYHKFNRTQRYDWADGAVTAEPQGNLDPSIPVNAGANRNDTTWNARIYLMIRAMNPIPTVGDGFDVTSQTSFDIAIRTYHQNLG
jgi:hypothetical protein